MDRLSPDGKIDYEIFRKHLEREVWLAENFQPFEDDPRIYGDYISESVYLLLTQSSLPRAVNLKNALARMAKIPPLIEIARRTIKNPPRVKVETAIRQTEGAIGFYKTSCSRWPARRRGRESSRAKARRDRGGARGPPRVPPEPRSFLEPAPIWRIGRGRFRQEARPRARRGAPADEVLADAEREAARVETRDGRDRPPALGHRSSPAWPSRPTTPPAAAR